MLNHFLKLFLFITVIFLTFSYNLFSHVVYVCIIIHQIKLLVCVKLPGNKPDSYSEIRYTPHHLMSAFSCVFVRQTERLSRTGDCTFYGVEVRTREISHNPLLLMGGAHVNLQGGREIWHDVTESSHSSIRAWVCLCGADQETQQHSDRTGELSPSLWETLIRAVT